MIKFSESKPSDEENQEESLRRGPSVFPVSWICNGCVRAIGRELIALEQRAVLCGVRLQEPLQGVRVGLTLAVRDGDGYGSEEQEAGTGQVSPHDYIRAEMQHVLVACSCRKKGERGKSEARLSAVVSSSCGRAMGRSSRKGSRVALSKDGGRCR